MQTSADAIILASAIDWHNRRSVLPWLLLSLLLHALVAWWLQGRSLFPGYQVPTIPPPIELTLRWRAPEAATPASRPVPEPQPIVESLPEPLQPDQAPPVPATESPSPARPQLSLPLDLSLPDITELEDSEATTDNGATVMNPELLERLQRAPRRTGVEARVERQASGDYQGGSWVEFVRSGDACFQVARANQLLSFDYDVWYRVPCPSGSR